MADQLPSGTCDEARHFTIDAAIGAITPLLMSDRLSKIAMA